MVVVVVVAAEAAAIAPWSCPGATAAWVPGGDTAAVGTGSGKVRAPPPSERLARPETWRAGGLSVMPESRSALSR